MPIGIGPVVPRRVIVLTVGVVAASLSATKLVSTEQHGHARGENQRGEYIADLAAPQIVDCWIGCFALDAVVVGSIVVRTVPIALEVRLVVFVGVGH